MLFDLKIKTFLLAVIILIKLLRGLESTYAYRPIMYLVLSEVREARKYIFRNPIVSHSNYYGRVPGLFNYDKLSTAKLLSPQAVNYYRNIIIKLKMN